MHARLVRVVDWHGAHQAFRAQAQELSTALGEALAKQRLADVQVAAARLAALAAEFGAGSLQVAAAALEHAAAKGRPQNMARAMGTVERCLERVTVLA